MLLYPHDPAWATAFAELATIYLEALGGLAIRIEHVGSTAVPDLVAKPIEPVGLDAAIRLALSRSGRRAIA